MIINVIIKLLVGFKSVLNLVLKLVKIGVLVKLMSIYIVMDKVLSLFLRRRFVKIVKNGCIDNGMFVICKKGV